MGDALQTIVGSEYDESKEEKKARKEQEKKEKQEKKDKEKSEKEGEKSTSEPVLEQEPVVALEEDVKSEDIESEEVVEVATISTDSGYYSASEFFKRIASLLVTISLSASNPSIIAGESSLVVVNAAITGRDLDYKELTLSLEYAKCNESSYAPIAKNTGDIRFADSVNNNIFFSNHISSVSVNTTISYKFPLIAAETANGIYCIRVKNDNVTVNVDASSVVRIAVQPKL